MYQIDKIKNTILCGDALLELQKIPSESIDSIITSPPYFNLRDYGIDGQLGLEATPEEYVIKLVDIFREVKRVLKDDGTLWLNLGDSYAGGGRGGGTEKQQSNRGTNNMPESSVPTGLKAKDLVGIPWRVAFALQADGWYLRQDIIWAKPNPMPESVTDRCTKSHEYIFLLSKSKNYYFDSEAIQEDAVIEEQRPAGVVRNRLFNYDSKENNNPEAYRKNGGPFGGVQKARKFGSKEQLGTFRQDVGNVFIDNGKRNKRSVWTVNTKPYAEAHFATFPQELITPCIKTTRPDAIILDPFMGSGTTAFVARSLGRNYLGIELNENYIKLAEKRLSQQVLGF